VKNDDRPKKMDWFKLGQVYYQTRKYRKAIEAFSKAIEKSPKDGSAYYIRGVAYNKLGSPKHALEDLKTAAGLGHEKAQKYLKSKGVSY
jgi:tetratricopeptide (TPR) repeat protein